MVAQRVMFPNDSRRSLGCGYFPSNKQIDYCWEAVFLFCFVFLCEKGIFRLFPGDCQNVIKSSEISTPPQQTRMHPIQSFSNYFVKFILLETSIFKLFWQLYPNLSKYFHSKICCFILTPQTITSRTVLIKGLPFFFILLVLKSYPLNTGWFCSCGKGYCFKLLSYLLVFDGFVLTRFWFQKMQIFNIPDSIEIGNKQI